MKRIITTGAVLLLSSLVSFGAVAQGDMTPEEQAAMAVETRQAVFELLRFNMAPLGNMARGGAFDEETAITSLERIIALAPMIPDVFAEDTREFHGDLETRALDSIWDNKPAFEELAMELINGAEEALMIIQNRGADGIRQAVGTVGPRCGDCHDRFRAE